MIKTKDIEEAIAVLQRDWGDVGKRVIEECHKAQPYNDTIADFMRNCIACGGNWGGMFLSGIKAVYPDVHAAIPEKMGKNAFEDICSTLILLGVDCGAHD